MFAPPVFDFDVTSGNGLTIRANGIPLVRGSSFQYYAPGWTRGYYSSTGEPQTVTRVDSNTIAVTFASSDGRAKGTQRFQRQGDRLIADYHFEWSGNIPAQVELTAAKIQASVFKYGTISVAGQAAKPLAAPLQGAISERSYGEYAKSFSFLASVAKAELESSIPLLAFDARGYEQPWARGESVIWLGAQAIEVAKGSPADVHIEWRIQSGTLPAAAPLTVKLVEQAIPDALVPISSRPVLIPKPKKENLNWEKTLPLTNNWSFPAGRFRFFEQFQSALKRRFRLPPPGKEAIPVDGGTARLGLRPGGYRILITPTKLSVIGQEDEGLRYGLERLAQLVFVKDGKLQLPTGLLLDEPVRDFRGVHLFVGPQANAFQKRLWERVLFPLGFNKAVLQCERTDWESLPGIATPMTMKKEDLVRLFAMYRAMNVEPIPLIQSFGHMEWLFANSKNLDLAINPEVPYAIDPRKPEAKAMLEKLWTEAIAALKPERIHFGLDEVDMRGFPNDPALVTDLWEAHLPFLGGIAKKNGKRMMLWGDQALAPGEAIDATLAHDKETAAKRRAAIPKGAEITDWHYKADPKPSDYTPTLQLWKNDGFRPIASTWYDLANIRGFNLSADLESVGTLQTTWAGYESNETAMLQNVDQFTAMVYAADTSWSARQEPVESLPYRPGQIFQKLMYGSPTAIAPTGGYALGSGPNKVVDGITFKVLTPIALGTGLDGKPRVSQSTLTAGGTGSELALLMDTESPADEGEAVAEIVATFADGKTVKTVVRYGWDVRATDDPALTIRTPREGNVSVLRVPFGGPKKLSSITIRPLTAAAGLRVHAATLIP